MNSKELKLKHPNLFSIIEEYYDIDNHNIDDTSKKILIDLIEDKLVNITNFRKNWTKGILKNISREVGYPTQGLTFGFIPNYGGMVEFSENLCDDKKAITQIQFYISLLRNVYTLQIVEIEERRGFNKFLKQETNHQTLKEIWVSPGHRKYNKLYLQIESYLDEILINPFFLPFSIQGVKLDGVFMPHTPNEANTVGDAFFRKIHPLNDDFSIFGNPEHRIDELL
ncbi:MAG: hypothetical protein AAF348_18670 [Bacteroidota bacterium]